MSEKDEKFYPGYGDGEWRNKFVDGKIHWVEPEELLANPYNHRIHGKLQQEHVESLLEDIGWLDTVLVNQNTEHVVDGHLRITLAIRKEALVPVVYLDLTEDEERVALTFLDKTSAEAGLSLDILETNLDFAHDLGFEEMSLDFAEDEELDLFDEEPPEDPGAEVSKADELQEKWQVETGQLWKLGEHRLICGDCTDENVADKLMDGEKAVLTWTDPPYGVSYGDKLKAQNPMGYRVRSIENDDLPDGELEVFIRRALSVCSDNSVDGAAIYVASPPGKQLPTLIKAFAGSGFEFRWHLVWIKDQIVLSRADYHFQHENILYGWKPNAAHKWAGDRKQSSCFFVDRPKRSDEHPTMKPVELVEAMLKNNTDRADIVLEPFAGSGTTLIACERLNRKCRAVEISPAYCSVVLERWSEMTGQEPELV